MTLQADWTEQLNRYISTVHTGGTPEQRAWAWARANHALDALLEQEHAALARRSKRETEELEVA